MLKNLSVSLSLIALVYTGCVSQEKKAASDGNAGRSIAGDTSEKEYLAYYQYNPKTQEEKVEVFSPELWRGLSAGARYQRFDEMYYANTRAKSNRGLAHVACFTGDSKRLAASFFSPDVVLANRIANVSNLTETFSEDGLMIGLQYTTKKQNRHFRLTACRGSGKGEFFSTELLDEKIKEVEQASGPESGRKPNATADDTPANPAHSDSFADSSEGFRVHDLATAKPVFVLRRDYDRAPIADVPWRRADLDLSNPEDAHRFAVMLQIYAYQGMANQDPSNPDNNFIAQNNKQRYWCHMPWLNQGANGREAVHGLTQERNLAPSSMWPHPPKAGDWGVAFFNGTACRAIGKVFANAKNPDWTAVNLDDGSVVYKILFTTGDFPEIHNAFTWNAHVNLPFQNARSMQPVRHIQMDIGVKDSQLRGLATDAHGLDASGWLMLTYYYDENYPGDPELLKAIPNLPEGLKHMRPMGIASGFTPKESIIFAGSKTNQSAGMLNGPADNPKSSCMGCHGTAGTSAGMVPGVMSTEQWRGLLAHALDFGQQFALAKRNFETKPAK